ncbi:MAG: T9SS type A sorting domain-containing protein [Ignavibacteria bacterium]|nr:T9SS type A sorting domain-containing protein [Ignavibacteria bacterium]
MKTKLTLIILLSIFFNNINAQWINSLTISPANPTTNDSIFIYADCSFPSGSCDEHSQTLYISAGYIYGQATHCLGMLTFICSTTDTFKIIPLPAGTYSFLFNANAGTLPSPCTPGINPGPTDSLTFIVTDATGLPDIDGKNFQFNLFPNPAKDKLKLKCKDESLLNKNTSLIIYSLTGQQLSKYDITDKEILIDVSTFPTGTYLLRIAGEKINEKHLFEVKR